MHAVFENNGKFLGFVENEYEFIDKYFSQNENTKMYTISSEDEKCLKDLTLLTKQIIFERNVKIAFDPLEKITALLINNKVVIILHLGTIAKILSYFYLANAQTFVQSASLWHRFKFLFTRKL